MTKQEFLTAFENSLRKEKVTADFVEEQVKLLSEKLSSLPDEDFQKTAGDENVSMLVKSSVEEYLARTRQTSVPTSKRIEVDSSDTVIIETRKLDPVKKEPKAEKKAKPDDEKSEPKVTKEPKTTKEPAKKSGTPKKKEAPKAEKAEKKKTKANDDVVSMEIMPVSKGDRALTEKKTFLSSLSEKAEARTPSIIFTIITILALPLLVLLAFVSIGTLVSLYFALAAVILAIVFLIIFIVFGGSLTALVALLYGATQIMQEPRYVGIHEIGLAFIILGGTILSSVLLYNVAVRFIPWILSRASLLFKLLFTGVKVLAEKVRKGCEKL
ncbi:MAG: hypothetical protein E7633_05610 [Ruminococcaceae bacterium]|nr:hypothetical protein [Oscillospiraceae bacterium]